MTARDDDKIDDELAQEEGDELEEEDEFGDDDEEAVADIDEFDGEADVEEDGEDLDAVAELTGKEQSARSLEIRRALEERREQRRMQDDIDYLDVDFDD